MGEKRRDWGAVLQSKKMIIRSNTLSLASTVIGLPVIGYDNIVTAANISSTTEDASFPASNLANPATFLKWKSAVTTGDEYIYILPGASHTMSYVGVAGHNWTSHTVSIEATTDPNSPFDSPGWTEIVQATVITDDLPLIFQFTEASYSALRIRIQQGADDVREAAVVYVGALLTLERSVKVDTDHIPINLGRSVDVLNGFSESGNFLGRIVRNQINESVVEIDHFSNSWYRSYFDPFVEAAAEIPFFISWAPNDYTADTGFCWLMSSPQPMMNTVVRTFSVKLEMRGIA